MTDADTRARERAASLGDPWADYRRRLELVRAGRAREAGLRRGDKVERMVWRNDATMSRGGAWEPEGVLCWVLRVTPKEIVVGKQPNEILNFWAKFTYEPTETESLFLRAYPEAAEFLNAQREVIQGRAIRLVEPARPDTHPPRDRKQSRSERPADRWCPVCETWNLFTPDQKMRSRRRGKRRPWGTARGGDYRDHTRECSGKIPYALAIKKFPERKGWWKPGVPIDCPGPRPGIDPSRPPLEVIEERINDLVKGHISTIGLYADRDIPWLRRLLATALRRAGKVAHECKPTHVYTWARPDMFNARTVVRCRVCDAYRWRDDMATLRERAPVRLLDGVVCQRCGRTNRNEAAFEAHSCFGIGELRIQTGEAGGSGATGNVTITGGFSGPPGFPMVFPEEP